LCSTGDKNKIYGGAQVEKTMDFDNDIQIKRLESASIYMNAQQRKEYMELPDEIAIAKDAAVPAGYKRCGRCGRVLKLYLFNCNSGSKLNCTGNCKECQKESSKKAYEKNKGNRDYKNYYSEHREQKLAQSRKYYNDHKDKVRTKQTKYHTSSAGKRVMKKAHAKRRYLLEKNAGIPYTREMVLDRDKMAIVDGQLVYVSEVPICILCGKPMNVERDIHMEHLIPVVLGGKNCFTNVGGAHQLCNLQKEKDARSVSVEQVEGLIIRSEAYIDMHPELFKEFFEAQTTEEK
jgi:hypothetical protein